MTDNEKQFEDFVRGIKFDDSPDPSHRDKLEQNLLHALLKQSRRKEKPFEIWRTIMKSKMIKLATAAVIILIAMFGITFLDKAVTPAWAIEQTIEALKNVRFMHIVRRNEAGQIKDERWIEIGPDGIQARYRQDSPGRFFVVDDRKTVFAHYKDRNTVVLYDPADHWYEWIHNLGAFFKDLAGDSGVTVEENIDYWGRKAHRVRWLKLNLGCYIDPESKLPIAMQGYDISYEEPPDGIFDIPAIPEGVIFVDKRPNAEPTEEPEWMKQREIANKQFTQARKALAAGEHTKSVELFTKVIEVQPRRNWAWFWMGSAYYKLGEYDLAIYNFSKVIGMIGDQPYCHLARGLAYRAKGMADMAQRDFDIALPVMIDALRNTDGATVFNYADDPLRQSQNLSTKQRLTQMIKRLQEVTGQNFGYDPDASAEEIERVISAWENWWSEHAADYGVVLR